MKYILSPLIVLLFGIVSCSSDKKSLSSEDFRIREPRIVLKKTNDQKNFGAFSQQVKPDLTLADEIQFEESEGSFNILYNTHCRFGEKELVQSGFRPNPKRARFLNFLSPEQLRLLGEYKDGSQCAFDFVAISPNSSRHYFKLPLVQMHDDSSASELSILHPKILTATTQIPFEQWSEYFLKLPTSGASQIAISCSSGEKTISINQQDRVSLSSIPLQELQLNWGLGAQNCRISQVKDSYVVGTSNNVVLVGPELKTQFTSRIGQHPRQTYTPFNPYLLSMSYQFEIKNIDPWPIRVRLPKQNMNFTGDYQGYEFAGYMMVRTEDRAESYEWIPESVITIPPQKTLVGFHYARIDREHCNLMYNSPFHSRNSIKFEIISDKLPQRNELILKQFEITAYFIPIQRGNEHPEVTISCNR